MNVAMITNWNSVVKPDDEVWHLGDVAMSYANAKWFVQQLNGKKHLILGNHDKDRKKMLDCGFINTYQSHKMKIGNKTVTLMHRPVPLTGYDQGRWLLHGHTHNSTPKVDYEKKWINLSVEWWNYTPVAETEIIKVMNQ